jgi:aminopeptidase N
MRLRATVSSLAAMAAATVLTPLGAQAQPVAATPVPAAERFDFDRTPGRLPKEAQPSLYRLHFELDPAREDFGGRGTIGVRLRQAMPALLLHADKLTAGAASIQDAAGRRRPLRVEPDAATSTWRLVPADGQALPAGRHVLHLSWHGKVNRSGEGLYRVDTAGGGPMLFTQLQAIHARTLFPGFDEPAFRARFEIAVRTPRGLQVASNMPRAGSRDPVRADAETITHRFAPTPPMPSYLVALAVGRFDTLSGRTGGVPLRVLTAPGKAGQAAYALGATRQLLPYFQRYFGLPYALPKLDQLAVPGVRQGAMEDWGLISYNEGLLLVDPARSAPELQRQVFALAAHEISHQWFGNLVTAASWDEIWLNEAFATWMEVKATDHFHPAWQVPLETRRWVDRTMARDASAATRAIRAGMVDESRVSAQFDNITYDKGGAVLSMLEQWLGEATFQRGLASYMRERRYSNAAAGDLWHHLARVSGRDVQTVAASWTDQPGVPLLTVTTACRQGRTVVQLAQQRFTLEPGLPPLRWRIPVTLRQGHRQATLLLDGAEGETTLGPCAADPVVANAGGRGYYRVKYAADAQPGLAAAWPGLQPADRMTLLSDAFALAQAGAQPMASYLALLQQLPAARGAGREALYAQAGDALVFLDQAFAGSPLQGQVGDAARALLAPELHRLGWDARPDDTPEDAVQRGRLIRWLARFGDPGVLAEARARFEADASGRAALPAALRPAVLTAVGRGATDGEFMSLRSQLLAARSEEERWLLARVLAGAGRPEQVDAVLQLALSGELPPNIASALPGLVAEAGRFTEQAYQFTRQHFETLARLAGQGPFGGHKGLLPNAAASFHDPQRATALLDDQRRLAGEAAMPEAERAAARIRLLGAVRAREAPSAN